MGKFNLKRYFDRIVLINLKSRPDRLIQVADALKKCDWPFKQPRVFTAVDGQVNPPPHKMKWKDGASAWGCLCSHRQILGQAIRDGVKCILILEDDICFIDDFRNQVKEFLHNVPDDWDQLMLGGQHVNLLGKPTLVKPGVLRCTDCERTHCYAVRGPYMRKLYQRWAGGGKFNGVAHCDWIMARDPEMQLAHKVYAPQFFIAGQERSPSDISGVVNPRQFWNPPGPKLSVINLHAPVRVVAAMRQYGWYTGVTHDSKTGIEKSLLELFKKAAIDQALQAQYLGQWIKGMQWQLGDDPDLICTIWHPLAKPDLVKASSLWPVYEVTADSVDSALKQVPRKLRKRRPAL